MKRCLENDRPKTVGQGRSDDDPDQIGNKGNGRRGGDQTQFLGPPNRQEAGVYSGNSDKRESRMNAAALISHFQNDVGKVKEVRFSANRNAHGTQSHPGDYRVQKPKNVDEGFQKRIRPGDHQ